MKTITKRLATDDASAQDSDEATIPEDEAFWREYLGEYLDEDEVRQLLHIGTLQRLSDMVAAHDILAVPTSRGMVFPRFQFVGGEVNSTISRVIHIFSDVVVTPYTTASWLRGARFKGKSVGEWLESGEDPEVVIQAAKDSAFRLAA